MRAEVRQLGTTREKASCIIRSWGSPLLSTGMAWLSIPKNGKHIETGTYEFAGDETMITGEAWQTYKVVVPFSRPFATTPSRTEWISGIANTKSPPSIWVGEFSCTATEITLKVQQKSESGDNLTGTRVSWFAYDGNECPNIQIGSLYNKEVPYFTGRFKFPKEFKTTPAVFLSPQYITGNSGQPTKIDTMISGVKEDGFDHKVGNPDSGAASFHLGYNFIAMT